MVLDEYRQAYVGATNDTVGIMTRIKQHWTGTKPLDRLICGDPQTSILSIDSFRALDTTRIFAAENWFSFDDENPLLDQFPPKFMLNRVPGGRDVAKLAAIVGFDKMIKRRQMPEGSDDMSTILRVLHVLEVEPPSLARTTESTAVGGEDTDRSSTS